MSFSVTVCVPVAPPALVGRVLASCVVARKRDARAWVDRNTTTWVHALNPGESAFVAWIHDESGAPVETIEQPRDLTAAPLVHGRDSLREMRAVRPTRTKTEEGGAGP